MFEPNLPIDFTVLGVAVSQQSSAVSKENWKKSIREAARDALPDGAWLLGNPLAVTIYIFPGIEMLGDVDNRVKPILDAMKQCVYYDDEQVERIVIQKFESSGLYAFRAPTTALFFALIADEPSVYIRITDDLHEDLD